MELECCLTHTLPFFSFVFPENIRKMMFSGSISYQPNNTTNLFIRIFEKLRFRLRKIKVDSEFLNSCKENDLCPSFLRYKMSSK